MNIKSLLSLSVAQLKRMAKLKGQIERLQSKLESLVGNGAPESGRKPGRKRRKMSAAARRKISLAQKARWAKTKRKA